MLPSVCARVSLPYSMRHVPGISIPVFGLIRIRQRLGLSRFSWIGSYGEQFDPPLAKCYKSTLCEHAREAYRVVSWGFCGPGKSARDSLEFVSRLAVGVFSKSGTMLPLALTNKRPFCGRARQRSAGMVCRKQSPGDVVLLGSDRGTEDG